jgi:UPF0716 family protein affecting phage T7 exclusion
MKVWTVVLIALAVVVGYALLKTRGPAALASKLP